MENIVDIDTPKQRKCLPVLVRDESSGRVMSSKVRATRKILEEMKRIIRACERCRYPTYEIGTCLKENRREIRWPGVSVRMDCVVGGVFGEATTGATVEAGEAVGDLNVYARVVPLAKRFGVLERHPLIFLTGSEHSFGNLIKCIGEHVMFKISESVAIEMPNGGRVRGEKAHAFSMPCKLDLDEDMESDDDGERDPLIGDRLGFYLEMETEVGGKAKSV